ncbi:MAG: glycosyltransferase, partial [Pontibacterium sp.]
MIRTGLIVCLLVLVALLSLVSLAQLHQLYLTVGDFLSEFSIIVLLSFTLLITFRYLALMVFSMLNNIRRTAHHEKISTQFPKVSILVPAYNEEVCIQKSLISIMEQTYPCIEIIVIDDGSSDATFVLANQLTFDNGMRCLKVFRKANAGKANALNYGMEHSTGELVMVVDADSKLSNDAIERMVPYFEDKRVAAVAGSVYVSNRINTLTKLQALEYIQGLNMARSGQAFFKLVSIIPGPIGVFRKNALVEVGGYDSDTFAEDADLTMKLIAKGYRIDFEPEAFAYTEAPDQLLDLLKQRYRWTRGILQSLSKHKDKLFKMHRQPKISAVLWYMFFESILWPFMDILAAVFFVYVSFSSGASSFIFFWWLLFTLLDLAGALYCVLSTRESLSLTWY